VHLDAVLAQAAQQSDRDLAGRAALGRRRLRKDDQRSHGADRD
jgi:hypothetical protein